MTFDELPLWLKIETIKEVKRLKKPGCTDEEARTYIIEYCGGVLSNLFSWNKTIQGEMFWRFLHHVSSHSYDEACINTDYESKGTSEHIKLATSFSYYCQHISTAPHIEDQLVNTFLSSFFN